MKSSMFIALLLLLLGSADVMGAAQTETPAAYGDGRDGTQCYIVTAGTLNVRTSPSLYKGKGKRVKRKDNVGFKLSKGDTIFVDSLTQTVSADGVEWMSFTHEGTEYFTDATRLIVVTNPRLLRRQAEANAGGFLSWLRESAPRILLVLTTILFIFWCIGMEPNKDHFRAEVRDSTGMRPMFMYSLRPYKTSFGVSAGLLLSFVVSILVLLAIGGVVWGLLWVVKLLLWVLIIVGWICLVGGVICLFGAPVAGVPLIIVGGIIVYFQDGIEAFGNQCVETGMAFFDAINVWQFSLDLVKDYWLHAIVISLIPTALFLLCALVVFLVALCLRGYEAWTTHRYNVKHPCPWCHEPSEPARYFDGQTEDGELPTPLRPGIYGLLHITHPKTGTAMPTLIAGGRDQLLRACPHCGRFINFEAGTEKHYALVGMPESGKTTLLCGIIGEMLRRRPDMHFTGMDEDMAKDFHDSVDYYSREACLDDGHLPQKTSATLKASVQCILPRQSGGMPYHLYFNDVGGELFTSSGNDQDMMLFGKDMEHVIFIIDPMTMELESDEVSEPLRQWLQKPEVATERNNRELHSALTACDSVYNLLSRLGRNMAEIDFTFVLVKSDLGWMGDTDFTNADALRHFVMHDMALPNLVSKTKAYRSVNFVAASVYRKDDRGVKTLCDMLFEQCE